MSHFHGTTLLSPIWVEMNRQCPPPLMANSVSICHCQHQQSGNKTHSRMISSGLFTRGIISISAANWPKHNRLLRSICTLILINLDTAILYGHSPYQWTLFRHALSDWRLCARCTNTSTAEGVMSSTFYLSVWLSFLSVCAANNALKACWTLQEA